MEKGFGKALRLPNALYVYRRRAVKQANDTKPLNQPAQRRPDVIAIRKTCDASGTGLSHYVLMDKQAKR